MESDPKRRFIARNVACDIASEPGSARLLGASNRQKNQQTSQGETMADQPVVPVSRLLDERGLGSFQIVLLIWSLLLVLIDGYDIAAIAFAAPHLVKAWGVSPKGLGPVFSASLVGVLFGSALFGWIGDRYGRKISLIAANLVFGVFTVAAAYATNLDQMFWLRLLGRPRHRRRDPEHRRHQRRIRRRAGCAPRSPSSRSASCRSAARSPLSSPPRWCRRTAGRSSS